MTLYTAGSLINNHNLLADYEMIAAEGCQIQDQEQTGPGLLAVTPSVRCESRLGAGLGAGPELHQ